MSSRFEGLEAQRGLAATGVVVFHAYQYARSGPDAVTPYAGSLLEPLLLGLDGMVDWFFVLSAFLLALPYASAVLEGRPGAAPGRFLARRAVRIVPLYVVAVLLVWAWRNPTLPGEWRDLVEHLLFVQVLDPTRIFWTIGPAWSLAVEVHFSLLLAVLGSAAARWSVGRSARARLSLLVAGVAALAAASVAYSVVAAAVLDVPATDWPAWFSLPSKLVVFAGGLALAVLVATRPAPLSRRSARLLAGAGLAVIVLAAYLRTPTAGGGALFHALTGLGATLVVGATVLRPVAPTARPVGRALALVGLVSYSLYLWHEPLLLGLGGLGLVPTPSPSSFPLTAAVLLAVSLPVAWLSYWLVEHPASNLRTRVDGPSWPLTPLPVLPAPADLQGAGR